MNVKSPRTRVLSECPNSADAKEIAESRRSRKSNPAERLTPFALSAIGLIGIHQVSDPDVPWHIAAGDLLRHSFDLNRPDAFTSATTHSWILEQWLPELALSYLHQWGGYGAVAWLAPVMLILFSTAVWASARRQSSARVALVLTVLAAGAVAGSAMTPRPQVFSFVFAVVTVDAWLRIADDGRLRWWLIPMTWLWACCHGFWIYSPLLGALFLVGMVIDGTRSRRDLVRLSAMPVATFLAGLVTPVGPVILVLPWRVHEISKFINEWQPPQAILPPFIALLVLLTLAVIGITRGGTRWHLVLPIAFAFVTAVMYTRSIAMSAAVVPPLVAAMWPGREQSTRSSPSNREQRRVLTAACAASCISLVICVGAMSTPRVAIAALDQAISAMPDGAVLCNDIAEGGWLILQHPDVQVTIDTREELYAVAHLQAYGRFMAALPGWDAYLQSTHCTYALVGDQTAVSEALVKQTHWSTVAKGGGYVLLKAPGGTS